MYQLSEKQIQSICTVIKDILALARDSLTTLDEICDADYMKGRKKYPLSAVVYSGFDVEKQNIPELIIQKILYGKGRYMPELYNSKVLIQIYSDTADFCNTLEVQNKIRAYGSKFEIIQFYINKQTYKLERLDQISFDGFTDKGRAKIGEKRIIYAVA